MSTPQATEVIGRDANSVPDFSLPRPRLNSCWDGDLTGGAVTTMTVPAAFNRVFFSFAAGTNVWVTMDGSAPVVPSGNGFSTQELNPGARQLDYAGGQTLKFISNTDGFVNLRFDTGS